MNAPDFETLDTAKIIRRLYLGPAFSSLSAKEEVTFTQEIIDILKKAEEAETPEFIAIKTLKTLFRDLSDLSIFSLETCPDLG